jgi:hypothetical protein
MIFQNCAQRSVLIKKCDIFFVLNLIRFVHVMLDSYSNCLHVTNIIFYCYIFYLII